MPNFEFSDEEKQLIETAREFTRDQIIPVAGELDEHGTFPTEICKKGWETGLMNCELPEAYGGLGLSCLAHCLVLEEISYGCTGINTTMAGNMLGSMPIILAGTEAQKKHYFDRLLAQPIFAA
jgi:acyl-CoA dehydrogenase